ncbi:MAG: histidine kinase, partial [Bizionia sp.]|nr:histidine kinase [Bizionia sp.]
TYLVKFSKLIRQFFELSKETEISLKEELQLIKNYLDIEKLRFKDKFEYHINVDDKLEIKHAKLPTMLLQPIVENSINHGIFNKIENGNVFINVFYISDKSFKVEILDDGVGFVNTQNQSSRIIKSSNVLEDRLRFLNKSGLWEITHTESELHPELYNKGSKSVFIITQL